MTKIIFGGGLGNQMFQYAFLYSKVYQIGEDSIEAMMHRNENEDYRDLSLLHYSCSLKLNVKDEKRKDWDYSRYIIKRKLLYNILKCCSFDNDKIALIMSKFGIIYAPSIYEYYPILEFKHNTIIEGAFQNWRYFDGIKGKLRKEFSLKQTLPRACKDYIEKMRNTNSVCIHIRRGDYLNSYYSSTLAVCNDSYYKEAIRIVENKVKNPCFFVFTNSHEDHLWIKENYCFQSNVHYVDLGNPDYIELYMMSNCKHFIISNSTFSWWAQYLSTYQDKIVVAPSIWYRGNESSKNIYMSDWLLVKVK